MMREREKLLPSEELKLYQAVSDCRQAIINGESPRSAAQAAADKWLVDMQLVMKLAFAALKGVVAAVDEAEADDFGPAI